MRPTRKIPWWAWPLCGPLLVLMAPVLVIGMAIVAIGPLFGVRYRRQLPAWAKDRTGESICDFVSEFNIRNTDTWVLRAVYEEFSEYLQTEEGPFPIHADDRWVEDLRIDDEDFHSDLLPDIAHRARRSLEDTKDNPFYDRVKTVRDLAGFLMHQPRLQDVEQVGDASMG